MPIVVTVEQALGRSGLIPFEARILLGHVLSKDRAWIAAHRDAAVDAIQLRTFESLSRRRRDGEPVAYLTGWREFYSLDLEVTSDVLIPRPETELLVELALTRIASDSPVRVLDLGTGCGAVALAIARECPRATVVGVDVSPAAIAIARSNAEKLGIPNARFVESNWYDAVAHESFDAIVANPPYIAADDPHLIEGDLRFEPRDALTPGGDGLDAIRILVAGVRSHASHGGWFFTEHGYDQASAVQAMLGVEGLSEVQTRRDLAGMPRVTFGRVGNLCKSPT
jgi:release factor glutamine methyltransferase